MNRRATITADGLGAAARELPGAAQGSLDVKRRLIRIAIFDDHTAIREAWMRALAAVGTFDVVEGGASASDAIACGQSLLPDLIVLDMQMPGGGLEALRQLLREAPIVKTVVLSSDDSEHLVSAAFTAGAFGFLTKGQPLISVINALQAVAAGEAQFSPGLARALVSPQGLAAPWRAHEDPGALAITAREEQILSRYGQGLTVEEISASIGVSPRTVAATFSNILQKLHEHAMFEAVLAQATGKTI